MRVMVREIDNGHASTPQASLHLYELIEPVLARGEEVVLDFTEVKHCSAPFLMETVGRLIEADHEDRMQKLLHCENLRPLWQMAHDWVIEKAIRRRTYPAGAKAADEFLRKYFAQDRED